MNVYIHLVRYVNMYELVDETHELATTAGDTNECNLAIGVYK